jgi:iron complex transport system substrate-binding protein
VLLGLPFRDTWYISPGNSYISQLIKDAGGRYLWQDTESSFSMPYSLENVYLQSLNADYWINVGSADSRVEIASYDSRLETIPCFRYGNLYNNNNRVTSAGGNDYWESGTLNPHIILKDIASILHPGLFNDYDLFYYRKIE